MIRVLFGSALSVLGLGVAAGYLGSDLVTGPRGEPLIVSAPTEAKLQAASFEGTACPSTLLFADSSGHLDAAAPGTRIVAFALRSGADDVAVAVEDYPKGAAKAAKTVVLVFNAAGQLVAAGDPASLHMQLARVPGADCQEALEPGARAPI